jgi:pyrroloquinoline quinone biosynthesis protein B
VPVDRAGAPLSRRAFVGALSAGALGHRIRPAAGAHALVLGSVQDGGLPQAGCYTPRCERARRSPRYVASLALIEPEEERYYLVDATPDLTRQIDLIAEDGFRRRAQARRPFDGIFLTHAHIGHYLGLAVLGREGVGIAPTPCYCTSAMAAYLSDNGPWSLMVDEGRLDLRPLSLDRWHRIDDTLAVRMLSVPHRHEFTDTVGFVFRGRSRSLLYLPDIDRWDAWDRRIEDVVAEIDVSLVDGSFYHAAEVPGRRQEDIRHPLIPDTMRRLQPAVDRGRRVVFTHLNNTNIALDRESAEAVELRERGFEVALEGQRFSL